MIYLKRILLVLSIFAILLIGLMVALPIIFKDRIFTTAKEEINKAINADVDFADVNISLFQSFPHISVGLNDFSVVGREPFAGIPLAEAANATVTVDFWSLLANEGPLEIRSVALNAPKVQVVVLPDGQANYDIAVGEPTTEEEVSAETTSDLAIALQSYSITDGELSYEDQSLGLSMDVNQLNHNGQGNFTLSVFDLATSTQMKQVNLAFDGVDYLSDANIDLDAVLQIDLDQMLFTLKNNDLQVNALGLQADGTVQLMEEDILMDLTFGAPSNDFKDLWSLIPNAYTADYSAVDVKGSFRLDGLVKGTYAENSYPAFRVRTKIEDGAVQYPDLPLGISNIGADIDVNSPSTSLDGMQIKGQNIQLVVGGDPFKADFHVSTPISDPAVAARVDGKIDLAKWTQAFPVDGIEELTGLITADITIDTRLSTIEAERYDDVEMNGQAAIDNLVYNSADLPPVTIEHAQADFSPREVQVNKFSAQLGKSDISASGNIQNILAYISPEQTMRGSFTANSNYFLADEWLEEDEVETVSNTLTASTTETEIFDRFDFELDATVDKLVYDTYELTDASLAGRATPNLITVDQVNAQLGESDFRGYGQITNTFDYLFDNGVLGGKLNIASNVFDLNPFMEETTTTTTGTAGEEEPLSVIPIPANIDMQIDAVVEELRYTNMTLNDLRGKLTIADEAVVVEEGTAKALGGRMDFAGAYDTKDISAPAYRFKYDLKQMDFGQSFNTFNTFSSFAPIGKFIQGKFSSSLILDGTLGDDMMPRLEDVNAEGLLETLNGSLTGLQPLNAIGNALDISELKGSLDLDNLKTWFTIANGIFAVKPFDVELADLPMTIEGTHSLTQQMNYTINTVIPRSKLGSNMLGNTVNKGISALVSQANQLGLAVNDAENLNVQIALTGSMADPKVAFKLLGTNGERSVTETVQAEVTDLVEDQVEEVKEEVTNRVNEAKQEAEDQAQAALDSAKVVAAQQAEAAKQAALEEARRRAGGVIDSTKLGTEAQDAVDDIKDRIKDFNPFRRKKKDGGGDK